MMTDNTNVLTGEMDTDRAIPQGVLDYYKTENSFFRVIDELVALNLSFRSLLPEGTRESMTASQFAYDFCTVHVNIGRGTGKTEYMKRTLSEGVVVVVHDNQTRMRLLKETKGANGAYIVNGGNANPVAFGADLSIRRPTFIIIDEPHLISDEVIGTIYNIVARRDMEQVFILLGE